MSASELRGIVRQRVRDDLLGEGYRQDDPTNLGGLVGQLFGEIRRGDDPRQTMGKIDGQLAALVIIDDAVKELNG